LGALDEKAPRRKLDADGVRSVRRTRGGLPRLAAIATAAIALGFASFLVVRELHHAPTEAGDDVSARDVAPSAAVPVQVERRARPAATPPVRVGEGDAPAAASKRPAAHPEETARHGEDQPKIEAGEYIAALRAAGETGGLAAFPPPGTRPPETGVVVPKDYQLPEGFARHYQTTDDGRQLEPILTLAPGYELVDENGNPIALGRERIVPPELAPPDLPVRMLEVPSASDRVQGQR
jgi:hypothetical protein